MKIIIEYLSGPKIGQQQSLTGPLVRLGRHPSCDIRFDGTGYAAVSSRHAEIRYDQGSYTLHDVGSRNGTLLDGQRVSGHIPLTDGSIVQLGQKGPSLRVTIEKAAATPPENADTPSAGQAAAVAAAFRLVVEHLDGGRAGTREMFTEPVVRFGRAPDCEVRFDPHADARASLRHAELRREGTRYVLYDKGSSNGTFVNGQRIEHHALAPNDVVEFGKGGPKLRFTMAAAPAPAGTGVSLVASRSVAVPAERSPGQHTVQLWIKQAVQKVREEPSTQLRSLVKGEARAEARRTSRVYAVAVGVFALLLSGAVMAKTTLDNRALRGELVQHVTGVQQALKGQLATTEKSISTLQGQVATASANATEIQAALQAQRARAAELQQQIATAQTQLEAVDAKAAQALRSFKEIAASTGEAIYMLAIAYPELDAADGFCSGFAVGADGIIATNGHCVEAIVGLLGEAENEGVAAVPIVIRNGDADAIYRVTDYAAHPRYRSEDIDIGYLQVDTKGATLKTLTIAAAADMQGLSTGEEVAVFGYPGELMDTAEPIATLFPGTIGRLESNGRIQHTSLTSKGTSGSPLLNRNGEVIGVNYAGRTQAVVIGPVLDANGAIVYDANGDPQMRPIQIFRSGIAYAIHGQHLADWISSLR